MRGGHAATATNRRKLKNSTVPIRLAACVAPHYFSDAVQTFGLHGVKPGFTTDSMSERLPTGRCLDSGGLVLVPQVTWDAELILDLASKGAAGNGSRFGAQVMEPLTRAGEALGNCGRTAVYADHLTQ